YQKLFGKPKVLNRNCNIPKGQLKISQQFIAGLIRHQKQLSPVGTIELNQVSVIANHVSVVPTGLKNIFNSPIPAINCWAIFI
ncbi:MAG: hypothetical protein V1872_06920, partial [bacterium]